MDRHLGRGAGRAHLSRGKAVVGGVAPAPGPDEACGPSEAPPRAHCGSGRRRGTREGQQGALQEEGQTPPRRRERRPPVQLAP